MHCTSPDTLEMIQLSLHWSTHYSLQQVGWELGLLVWDAGRKGFRGPTFESKGYPAAQCIHAVPLLRHNT